MYSFIIKSNILLIIIFLTYSLFFRNDSHFKFTRIFLLAGIFVSLVFPLIHISFSSGNFTQLVSNYSLEAISINPQSKIQESFSVFTYIKFLYILISALLLIRFLYNIAKIFRIKAKSVKQQDIYVIDNNFGNFSFFGWIFIRREDFYSEHKHSIIRHEQIHSECLHSLDNILLELLTVFFWFNPFVWLYRSELKKIHEFIVDKEIISLGIDSTQYKKMLVEQAIGRSFVLADNFNKLLILKRLKMMKTKTSNTAHLVKVSLTLPLIILATVLFSVDLKAQNNTQTSESETYVMPVYPGGSTALSQDISNNIVYPEKALKNKQEGTVFVRFTVDENGEIKDPTVIKSTNEIFDKAAIDAILKIDKKFKPGQKDGKNVAVTMTVPISFSLDDKK